VNEDAVTTVTWDAAFPLRAKVVPSNAAAAAHPVKIAVTLKEVALGAC
jgi:hypothetical protein